MLREFFVNEHPVFLYKPFGFIHFCFILLLVLVVFLLIKNREKIAKIQLDKSWKFLRISAILLLINMLLYTFGNLYFGCFDYKEMLPLHLCFIANYMFIYGILFKKENILKITIFMSFIGPIPAVLWPNLVSTFDNFNFWQYVISHHYFLSVSLFSYYALGYKVRRVDYIKTFILLNVFLLCIAPFNRLFSMNYIFTEQIPDNVLELYPFIEPFPPLLVLEVVGLVISYFLYRVLIGSRNKELEQKEVS